MSLQTLELNSIKIIFDREKTFKYKTGYNKPCDCQDCRNFYENIKNNAELVQFLNDLGIDYHNTEDAASWDLGEDIDSLIHSEGYYGVFGTIDGGEASFNMFGVKITFANEFNVNHDRTGDFFWVIVEGDFPYILAEEREMPITFLKNCKLKIIDRIKSVFQKN